LYITFYYKKRKGQHLRNVHNCTSMGVKYGVLIWRKTTDGCRSRFWETY